MSKINDSENINKKVLRHYVKNECVPLALKDIVENVNEMTSGSNTTDISHDYENKKGIECQTRNTILDYANNLEWSYSLKIKVVNIK